MRSKSTRAETVLLADRASACWAWLCSGRRVAQPAQYHEFADQRMLWGLPFAMDVLSNRPFALAGVAGGWSLMHVAVAQPEQCAARDGGVVLRRPGAHGRGIEPGTTGSPTTPAWPSTAAAWRSRSPACSAWPRVRVSERAGAALGLAVLLLGPSACSRGP